MFSNLMLCVEFAIRSYWYFPKILVLHVSAPTRILEDFSSDITEIRIMYQYDMRSLYENLYFELLQSFQATTEAKIWPLENYEKFVGAKNFRVWKIFYIFGFWGWKWHSTPKLIILSDRSCMFLISLGGFEAIFNEKSRRNSENEVFLKIFFWHSRNAIESMF